MPCDRVSSSWPDPSGSACGDRSTRRHDIAFFIALSLAAAGCATDVSLEVVVEHDPSIAPFVDRTVISIYAKPDLACTQIEYDDVTADELRGALVAEADLGMPLANIPRVDAKLVVARGYHGDTLVAAGCNDKGELDHAEKITVATVPAATVTLGVGMGDTRGLQVATTDFTNASIDGRGVAWRMYGAAGTSADPARFTNIADGEWEPKHKTCTTDGDVVIHPQPPLLPGGFGLAVRASWATAQPRLFTGFTQIDRAPIDVATFTGTPNVAPCALERRAGIPKLVCMTTPTATTTWSFDVASLVASPAGAMALPASTEPWVGVVGVDNANGDRDVYAIDNRGAWAAIDGAPAVSPGATWCGSLQLRCGSEFATQSLQVVPACGSEPAYLLSQSTDGIGGGSVHLRRMPIRGGAVAEFGSIKDGAIVAAGCVAELQPQSSTTILRQTVVVEVPRSGLDAAYTSVNFACSANHSPCEIQIPQTGVAYAFTHGDVPELVGTTFDETGSQLAHWVFAPAAKNGIVGPKDRFVERSRQVAAAPPQKIVLGHFDADDGEDTVWSFATKSDIDIQIAYAREVAGAPLSALTSTNLMTVLVPQVIAMERADFNSDGFDEVVFVFSTTFGNTTTIAASIVPTGVPYRNPPPVPEDPKCP